MAEGPFDKTDRSSFGFLRLPHPGDETLRSIRTKPPHNIEMNLTKTKIYKIIANGSRGDILKVSREYLLSSRNPNLRHPVTGGNLLHHIVDHAEKFSDPEMLTIIYTLACVQVEVDAQDFKGDTALHCVVRHRGAYRIMIALIRMGADTGIRNASGQTAEDILMEERPPGHEEMTHWYFKFKPGLWCELRKEAPDVRVIERLLQSWCRVKTVKSGQPVDLKNLVGNGSGRKQFYGLLKKYEHTTELVTALLAGCGSLVRKWIKDGTIVNFDVNTQDLSYQFRYPDYAPCPQSLLVAIWQTNSLDAVDVLMELGPDTSLLQISPPECVPVPLIFQLFKKIHRPQDTVIIQRVLESSDISVRNHIGQTLLFQAISNEEPLNIIQQMLHKGINFGARDNVGRTARDLAEQLDRRKYVKAVDDHLIQLVKNKDFSQIERLILNGYDHVADVKDTSGRLLEAIALKFSTVQTHEIIQKCSEIQTHVSRVFLAVDEGNMIHLQRLLSCKKYASGLDMCGRTPLLKAILGGRRNVVMKLITDCHFTINTQDSLGRSALHYAYLFMDDPDMIGVLLDHGANPYLRDWRGHLPQWYKQSECGIRTYCLIKREVLDADLDVYTYRTRFGDALHKAIQEGDLLAVKRLMSGLEGIADVTRYSHFLFECVDLRREDIAIYLISSGLRTDIFKSICKCHPESPLCSLGECNRVLVSLKQRALKIECKRVVRLINRLEVTNGQ